jgi:2-oxoglutarate dehydrogenase E2 component (dihydrolipoamide succinyltransferase)
MAIEIVVPTLGESITEATVGQWLKKKGETVSVDEPLCELETDKVTVEVPAPAAGVLTDISVQEGDTVAIGAVLGAIEAGAGATAAPAVAAEPDAAKPAAADGADNGMPPSPAARKAMTEAGMSADAVEGSGKRGQILKEDVAAAQAAGADPAPSNVVPVSQMSLAPTVWCLHRPTIKAVV